MKNIRTTASPILRSAGPHLLCIDAPLLESKLRRDRMLIVSYYHCRDSQHLIQSRRMTTMSAGKPLEPLNYCECSVLSSHACVCAKYRTNVSLELWWCRTGTRLPRRFLHWSLALCRYPTEHNALFKSFHCVALTWTGLRCRLISVRYPFEPAERLAQYNGS